MVIAGVIKMYQIFNCSPEAEKMLPAGFDRSVADCRPITHIRNNASRYPFRRMQIGHCFIISYAEFKEDDKMDNLRAAVSKANKSMGPYRKFKIIKHDDSQIVEVARIL